HALEQVEAGGMAGVDAEAELVAVQVVVHAAAVEVLRRAGQWLRETDWIGTRHVLDLDDLRPEVREDTGCLRSGHHPREVQYPNAVQRPPTLQAASQAGASTLTSPLRIGMGKGPHIVLPCLIDH